MRAILACVLLIGLANSQLFPWDGWAASDSNTGQEDARVQVAASSANQDQPVASAQAASAIQASASNAQVQQQQQQVKILLSSASSSSAAFNQSSREASGEKPQTSEPITTQRASSPTTSSAAASTTPALSNLNPTHVVIALGSGCQVPEKLLNNHSQWAWNGPHQLSNFGRRVSYELGLFLRLRYPAMFPAQYNAEKIGIYSSSNAASMATLQTFLASLFVPQGVSQWHSSGLAWQPIPFNVKNEALNLEELPCSPYKQILKKIQEEMTDFEVRMLKENQDLIKFAAEQTGWLPNLAEMSDLASNLAAIKQNNEFMPLWVQNNPFNQSIFDYVLRFGHVFDKACAKDRDCQQIAAGAYLGELFAYLAQYMEYEQSARIYSMAARELFSVAEYFGLDSQLLNSSATLLFEIADEPKPAIRVFLLQPSSKPSWQWSLTSIPLKGCTTEWCSLVDFMNSIKADAILDWRAPCKVSSSSVVAAVQQDCKSQATNDATRIVAGATSDTVNVIIDCNKESDESGETYCNLWAKADYCNIYRSVREFYCRKTCFCNPKFRRTE